MIDQTKETIIGGLFVVIWIFIALCCFSRIHLLLDDRHHPLASPLVSIKIIIMLLLGFWSISNAGLGQNDLFFPDKDWRIISDCVYHILVLQILRPAGIILFCIVVTTPAAFPMKEQNHLHHMNTNVEIRNFKNRNNSPAPIRNCGVSSTVIGGPVKSNEKVNTNYLNRRRGYTGIIGNEEDDEDEEEDDRYSEVEGIRKENCHNINLHIPRSNNHLNNCVYQNGNYSTTAVYPNNREIPNSSLLNFANVRLVSGAVNHNSSDSSTVDPDILNPSQLNFLLQSKTREENLIKCNTDRHALFNLRNDVVMLDKYNEQEWRGNNNNSNNNNNNNSVSNVIHNIESDWRRDKRDGGGGGGSIFTIASIGDAEEGEGNSSGSTHNSIHNNNNNNNRKRRITTRISERGGITIETKRKKNCFIQIGSAFLHWIIGHPTPEDTEMHLNLIDRWSRLLKWHVILRLRPFVLLWIPIIIAAALVTGLAITEEIRGCSERVSETSVCRTPWIANVAPELFMPRTFSILALITNTILSIVWVMSGVKCLRRIGSVLTKQNFCRTYVVGILLLESLTIYECMQLFDELRYNVLMKVVVQILKNVCDGFFVILLAIRLGSGSGRMPGWYCTIESFITRERAVGH